ncbi:hypothetical protein ACFQAV_09565 [Companilactobacillus huachuanensis]|uniref:Restriction endonuclease n=1 Tax=Companilactobacillus huachuanensis TaxID=2559914 RepID=A0ABW1RM64_9LACO|nr:hypothetical protein [Companilactobacillus huachuanensis]
MNTNGYSLIDSIEKIGEKTFYTIPLNAMKETSVTDNILSEILLPSNAKADLIYYDDSYKETGKKGPSTNNKTRTCADYVLYIKDKNKKIHKYAFQAKNGKEYDGKGNVYTEINHKIGNNGDYQIDGYDEFLKNNPYISGYYIFYNGNYKNVNNTNSIKSLNGQSFWIIGEERVKGLMGTDYNVISIDNIIGENSHVNFISFLRGLV